MGDRGQRTMAEQLLIPAPITDLKLVKWRHWKPSRIKELGPINQKVLEGM